MNGEPTGLTPVLVAVRDMVRLVAVRDTVRVRVSGLGYLCIEDYVLDRGREWRVSPLSAGEEKVVSRSTSRFKVVARGCFLNAQRLALHDPTGALRYVEGFARGLAGIHVHHGWCVIGDKVVDPTWGAWSVAGARSGQAHQPDSDWAYHGVAFTPWEIMQAADTRKPKGALWSIIDNQEAGWPELHRGRLRPLPPTEPRCAREESARRGQCKDSQNK